MCREHRAALAIQTAWRGHTARADFLRYRRGVVAAQNLWRSKLARRKLRALRAEAREAGKLLQVCVPCSPALNVSCSSRPSCSCHESP